MRGRSVFLCLFGVGVVVGILGIEYLLRLAGCLDFPLFNRVPGVEYLPVPSQSGLFLGRNRWAFNNLSMGTRKDWVPASENLVLLGNSIVLGSISYDQSQKLGAQLSARMGSKWEVWPIAAGGWTDVNEMAYLDNMPEVSHAASCFAWEFMVGGLSGANPWNGEYVSPTAAPVSAIWYLANRYVIRPTMSGLEGLPSVGPMRLEYEEAFIKTLKMLSTSPSHRPNCGVIWLYPKRAELEEAMSGREWLPEKAFISRVAKECNVKLVDISKSPDWGVSYYSGDGVHPTVRGNEILASILYKAINDNQSEPLVSSH